MSPVVDNGGSGHEGWILVSVTDDKSMLWGLPSGLYTVLLKEKEKKEWNSVDYLRWAIKATSYTSNLY